LIDIFNACWPSKFYDGDENGLPRAWIQKVRHSMSRLTPRFSGNRMLREYVNQAYIGAAAAYRRRTENEANVATRLQEWRQDLDGNWKDVHFGEVRATLNDGDWQFDAQLYLGDVEPAFVQVEIYADARNGEPFVRIPMERDGSSTGAVNSHRYTARAPGTRPAEHYTPRVVPFHSEAAVPLENQHVIWFRGRLHEIHAGQVLR
jgi:starch phosphorylase